MTPAQITVLVVDLLSVAVLGLGLALHRRLSMDRHAFLLVLHAGEHVKKPARVTMLGWMYMFATFLILLFSIAPFLFAIIFS